jgi:hypothetical protein
METAMRQQDLFKSPPKPWNAGRIVGPKAPLKPKHVWAIRQQLKTTNRVRDLALFNCALDAKLRALFSRRPADPYRLSLLNPLARRSRPGYRCGAAGPTIGYSRAAAGRERISERANTPAWWIIGSG